MNALAAGGVAYYRDMPSNDPHEALVGREYETLQELLVFGIKLRPDFEEPIDYYIVMMRSGIAGPLDSRQTTLKLSGPVDGQ